MNWRTEGSAMKPAGGACANAAAAKLKIPAATETSELLAGADARKSSDSRGATNLP